MASKDELKYFVFLLSSVLFGWFIGRLPVGSTRLWFSTAVGFLVTVGFCGRSALHPLFTIVVNGLIIKYLPDCHRWSFIFTFGYLAFFRTTTYFGLPETGEIVNAIQLILTLRTVGVAFEVHDTQLRDRGLAPFASSSAKFSPLDKYADVRPGFMDVVHYCLCFMGIMTGPYYKYKVFEDMIYSGKLDRMPREKLALHRLRILPVYVVVFLIMSTVLSYSTLWGDDFYESTTAPYRYLYLVALFVFFRLKFYIAWLLAESACIASGLGLYPAVSKPKPGHGPSEPDKIPIDIDENTEYSYETVYNIDEFAVEFVPTVREALKAWNMTTQYWLAWHVYRRVPWSSGIRTVLVMFVSAYWHGLHGGYYVSLLTVPLMLMAENWITKYDNFWAKFCNWFLRMRAFEYMSVGFMCLSGARTIRYWQSIYFGGHIVAVLIYLIGVVYRKMTKPPRTREPKEKRVQVNTHVSEVVKSHVE